MIDAKHGFRRKYHKHHSWGWKGGKRMDCDGLRETARRIRQEERGLISPLWRQLPADECGVRKLERVR